jgi:transposase-like protein
MVYLKFNGAMHYLWRAVDQEGELQKLRHQAP